MKNSATPGGTCVVAKEINPASFSVSSSAGGKRFENARGAAARRVPFGGRSHPCRSKG
jgi:hypothetical protein